MSFIVFVVVLFSLSSFSPFFPTSCDDLFVPEARNILEGTWMLLLGSGLSLSCDEKAPIVAAGILADDRLAKHNEHFRGYTHSQSFNISKPPHLKFLS